MSWFDALVWIGFGVGHACIWMALANFLFGLPINHHWLDFYRKLTVLGILAGPIVLALHGGGTIAQWLYWSASPSCCPWLTGYLVVCQFFAWLVLPLLTLRRWMRAEPAVVVSQQGITYDIAAELGQSLWGTGKAALLSRIPFNECFHVEVHELTLAIPKLPPAWEGLTILHLSDLHFGGTPTRPYYERVIEHALAEGTPDLVAITGDLIDSETHHRWLIPILGRLRWQVAGLAILGNHDSWFDMERIRRRLERLGMLYLDNDWREIRVRGEPMIVIGHQGPWIGPRPDLRGCPETGFRLCLSHTPDNLPWCKRHGVRLMLSGHVHGGQIRLPLLGSVFVPSMYGRRYDMGVFQEGPTILHVSRGLAGKEPLRFRCSPQVTRIVLRGAPSHPPAKS